MNASDAMSKGDVGAYALLALVVACNVAAQLALKQASLAGSSGIGELVLSPFFVFGCLCLGLQMILWLAVLRRLPLTIAHPIGGVVFVIVPLASHLLWLEPLPPLRIAGMGVITAGVILVGGDTRR